MVECPQAENYCDWAGFVTPFVTGAFGEREPAAPGPPLPGGACAPSAPRLGINFWIFVCALTPVSPGFSMLDSGVETCPAPGGTCASPFPAASSATTSTPSDNRGQRFTPFQQVSLIIQRELRDWTGVSRQCVSACQSTPVLCLPPMTAARANERRRPA